MSTPVKLRLYCSICARNDFYMDRIRAVADGLGLDYTLEKITDDDVIDRMDLLMAGPDGISLINRWMGKSNVQPIRRQQKTYQ